MHLLAPTCQQIYYPVPNEVYRDEWDDVQVRGDQPCCCYDGGWAAVPCVCPQ